MHKNEIKIIVVQYDDITELPENDRQLILAAREIAPKAYAPYSGFKVGAALRMANGHIVTGNNQENASSPAGSCAERSALFWANANFPATPITAIAITAIDRSGKRSVRLSPCGVCRQALLETEIRFRQPVRVLLDSLSTIIVLDNIESLLPLSFNYNSLTTDISI
jgi:cytidine deaminase